MSQLGRVRKPKRGRVEVGYRRSAEARDPTDRLPLTVRERTFARRLADGKICPRLCKNSACQLAHRKSFSIFVNRRTNSAGDHDREKAVEKTILRNLSSCTFLHSLAP